jgi:hypothetical protein
MRIYVLSLALIACTSTAPIRPDRTDEPPKLGDKSGTRLKVRYYVGADGSEQTIGFFDSVRREKCSFAVAADGVVRCLPEVAPQFSMFTRYFSDARCTQELAELPTGCRTGYVAKAVNASACSSGSRVFPIAPTIFTGAVYVDNALGGCTRAAGPGYGHDYYAIGAEVPPISFQSATEVVR